MEHHINFEFVTTLMHDFDVQSHLSFLLNSALTVIANGGKGCVVHYLLQSAFAVETIGSDGPVHARMFVAQVF